MRLHHIDLGPDVDPAFASAARMTRCCDGPFGAVRPVRRTVLVHRADPAITASTGCPLRRASRQPLQHQHPDALGPADAVGAGGERLAPPVRRQPALPGELGERRRRWPSPSPHRPAPNQHSPTAATAPPDASPPTTTNTPCPPSPPGPPTPTCTPPGPETTLVAVAGQHDSPRRYSEPDQRRSRLGTPPTNTPVSLTPQRRRVDPGPSPTPPSTPPAAAAAADPSPAPRAGRSRRSRRRTRPRRPRTRPADPQDHRKPPVPTTPPHPRPATDRQESPRPRPRRRESSRLQPRS